ncbi:MAG: hypothetical protein ACERKZ_11300 [Lachnotalea sp.]
MSTQNDLLNGSNNKNESLASEGPEHTKMCSNWQDDSDNMFPYYEDDTCGDRLLSTKGEYVEILEFTHFARVFKFTGKSNFGRKKEISNEIKVSVVVELV